MGKGKQVTSELPLPACHGCGERQLWGSHSLLVENVLVFGLAYPLTMEITLTYTTSPAIPFLCQVCLVKGISVGMAQLEDGAPS